MTNMYIIESIIRFELIHMQNMQKTFYARSTLGLHQYIMRSTGTIVHIAY